MTTTQKNGGGYINDILIYNPEERLKIKDYDVIIITSVPGRESIIAQLKNLNINETMIDTSYINQALDSRRIFCESLSVLHKDISNDICVAEAGVFQGDFAKIINLNYNKKKLYLFDTFEGFSEKDIIYERENGLSQAEVGDYNLTSEDLVIKKMSFPENCIIKKGFFPDSANGIKDKFCFVNLDLDLYKPTMTGLLWFKDKMVKTGCILVHDYFAENFTGVREAVDEFLCMNDQLYKLPIGDGISIAIVGF